MKVADRLQLPAVAVTAVPIWAAQPLGELSSFALAEATDRVRTVLRRGPLRDAFVIGGWDFAYLEHWRGEWSGRWMPHLYLILFTRRGRRSTREALKKYFPRDDVVIRPLKIRRVTDLMSAVTYAFKSIFVRRISYRDDRRPYRDDHANTRTVTLRTNQLRELHVFLGKFRLTDRLLLRGIRRRGCKLMVDQ